METSASSETVVFNQQREISDHAILSRRRTEKEFKYVRKMWKLVAGRVRNAVYGRGISLGSWRSLGPVFWSGRNQAGAAVDARRRAQARLRVDEGAGDEVGRHL